MGSADEFQGSHKDVTRQEEVFFEWRPLPWSRLFQKDYMLVGKPLFHHF